MEEETHVDFSVISNSTSERYIFTTFGRAVRTDHDQIEQVQEDKTQ
jgi:hypothetical protein